MQPQTNNLSLVPRMLQINSWANYQLIFNQLMIALEGCFSFALKMERNVKETNRKTNPYCNFEIQANRYQESQANVFCSWSQTPLLVVVAQGRQRRYPVDPVVMSYPSPKIHRYRPLYPSIDPMIPYRFPHDSPQLQS